MLPKTRTSKRLVCRRLLTLYGSLLGRAELLSAWYADYSTEMPLEQRKEMVRLAIKAHKIDAMIRANFATEREVCLGMDLCHFREGWPCAHYH